MSEQMLDRSPWIRHNLCARRRRDGAEGAMAKEKKPGRAHTCVNCAAAHINGSSAPFARPTPPRAVVRHHTIIIAVLPRGAR
jgi:hypothetical protein